MYLFYIDESGNRDFSHLEKERFYILTAVGMYENHWKRFHFDITRFKQSIIDRIMRDEGITLDVSTDAEVKSTYLRNPKERDKHPFSKFQTDTERLKLSSMFYDQLKQCKAVLISAVIDKQAILPNSHLADQKQSTSKHGSCFASVLRGT